MTDQLARAAATMHAASPLSPEYEKARTPHMPHICPHICMLERRSSSNMQPHRGSCSSSSSNKRGHYSVFFATVFMLRVTRSPSSPLPTCPLCLRAALKKAQ